MDQTTIRAAVKDWLKVKELGIFELDEDALDKMGYNVQRYQDDGPGKHRQEDDGITTAPMFEGWARELLEDEEGLDPDELGDQAVRLIAEHMYNVLGYGINGLEDHDWEESLSGTVSLEAVANAEGICKALDAVDTAFKSAGFDRDDKGWFKDGWTLEVRPVKR